MNTDYKQCRFACLAMALIAGNTVLVHAADLGEATVDHQRFDNTPLTSWQGLYAGITLGALGAGGQIDKGNGNGKLEMGEGSLGLGVHLGYNFNPVLPGANGAWMFGSEIDISSAGLNAKKTDSALGTVNLEAKYLSTLRGRFGYTWDKLYLYGTAGLAISDLKIGPATDKTNEVRAGTVIGFGAEYRLRDQWTMRAELLAIDLGEQEYKFSGTTRKVTQGMGTLRFGLSRKF